VVDINVWRTCCYSGMITRAETKDAKSKAFKRAVLKLQDDQLIGVWDNYVWIW
jgi:hypothetical protein